MIASEILYGSGTFLNSAETRNALLLAYDRILLPSDTTYETLHVRYLDGEFEFKSFNKISSIDWSHPDEDDDPMHVEFREHLEDDLRPYLKSGLVQRVPPEKEFDLKASPMAGLKSIHPDLWFSILAGPVAVISTDGEMQQEFVCDDFFHQSVDRESSWTAISLDISNHLARTDLSSNMAFDLPYRSENINAILSEAAFQVVLPVISRIAVDDIMELRLRTEDFREGFRTYIQSISLEARQMASAGEDITEVRRYCRDLVSTQLTPLLAEHQRQLSALKTQKVAGNFEIISKFLEIETGPWAPKFWTELFKILSSSTNETAAELTNRKSNLNLTLNLLRLVGEDVSSIGQKKLSDDLKNKAREVAKLPTINEAIRRLLWRKD
ncbi:hypothetical protein [Roseibium album]|uniref:Uncharacterized protein n=1 Tax=Roseibium album TaxID=311410 RepID=A0A0M7A7U5_9HYPH|nr:hypothetical protein [Roseibium album]CTQ58133.1 hypothetical protein LA5094_00890 [Roseibium album]CTQ65645.1 hypothetical protein LA5096_00801 [Roseibium album]CTQ70522.1 hypothetical protein LA5095_01945 [Roseibium album]